MADRFWVGASGNWSDNTNHWSASSGGAPGASTPTSSDNVFFDANAGFTGASKTVTVDTASNCANMDWTGAPNNPRISMGGGSLTINGDITLISGMAVSAGGNEGWTITMGSTTRFFTTANVSLNLKQISTSGTGTLDITGDISMTHVSGLAFFVDQAGINTNGYNITANQIRFASSSGTYDFTGSTLTLVAGGNFFGTTVFNFSSSATLTAPPDLIVASGSGSLNLVMDGGNKNWADVTVSGAGYILQSGSWSHIDTLTINGSGNSMGGFGTIDLLDCNQSFTIGGGTITDFDLATGKTYTLTGNQTVTNFTTNGTSGSHCIVKSDGSTTRNLCVTTWNVPWTEFQRIAATCTLLECCTCVDNGSNSGIDFCDGGAFLLALL